MRRNSGLDHWSRLFSVVTLFIGTSLDAVQRGTIETKDLVRKSNVTLTFLSLNPSALTHYNRNCLTDMSDSAQKAKDGVKEMERRWQPPFQQILGGRRLALDLGKPIFPPGEQTQLHHMN